MKKLTGILFSFAVVLFGLALSFFPCVLRVSADETKPTLHFNLTCEGENVVSKETGDIITVTYTVENATENTAYDIATLANEIYYNHEFFELVEDSAKVEEGLNLTTKLSVYSWGEHRVYFNGFEIPTKTYGAKQVIGSFQLKIIATEGSSTIYSLKMLATADATYEITFTDLGVRIGDAPIIPVYELKFETNGGSAIFSTKKEAGTVIDLSAYQPVKKDYVFVGWYSDAGLTNLIQTIELNEHTTIYAKWREKVVEEDSSSESESESEKPTEGDDFDWKWLLILLAILLVIIFVLFLLVALAA